MATSIAEWLHAAAKTEMRGQIHWDIFGLPKAAKRP